MKKPSNYTMGMISGGLAAVSGASFNHNKILSISVLVGSLLVTAFWKRNLELNKKNISSIEEVK